MVIAMASFDKRRMVSSTEDTGCPCAEFPVQVMEFSSMGTRHLYRSWIVQILIDYDIDTDTAFEGMYSKN